MKNKILLAAKPAIDHLLGFRYRLESGEEINSNTLRGEIISSLAKMESAVQSNPSMQPKLQTIKYIMTGFADEVCLSSNWNQAKEWHDRLLEMEFFKTSVAGERFFELLENEGYRDSELAELFYTLIVLGFRGRYRNREEQITAIKQRVYAVLSDRLPDDERRLTPGAEHIIGGNKQYLPKIIGLSAIAAVLLVSILVYFVTSQWMWNDIATVISDISRSISN